MAAAYGYFFPAPGFCGGFTGTLSLVQAYGLNHTLISRFNQHD
jgi:hypothetical protein